MHISPDKTPGEARSALVAQLDRASGFEPEGRRFESFRVHKRQRKLNRFRGGVGISNPAFF